MLVSYGADGITVTVDPFLLSSVKQCVGFLYNERLEKGALVKKPRGTCFFAGRGTPDRKSVYLVTAKHVYEDLLDGDGSIYGLLLQHQGVERNYPAFRMGHIALRVRPS